jgi:hypothetical protein
MLMFVKKKEADKLDIWASIRGQLFHDRKDIIKDLWDKTWKESEDI